MLFGEGSGDIYAQQVGLLVGELLQLPVVNAVSKIERHGERILVERTLENGSKCLNSAPRRALRHVRYQHAAHSVNESHSWRREKPSPQASDIGWTPVPPLAELVAITVPPQTERKRIILENDSADAIAELADHLKKP